MAPGRPVQVLLEDEVSLVCSRLRAALSEAIIFTTTAPEKSAEK